MARKSSGLDQKMLMAGMALLRQKGASGLSVREVTAKAGANLGMFNYHFKSKEAFIIKILEQVYLDFISELNKKEGSDSLRLEQVLFKMAVFSRDHNYLLVSLLSDILSGEKTVIRFLKSHFSIHFSILSEALAQHCAVNALSTTQLDHAFRFLIGSVGLPNLIHIMPAKFSKTKTACLDSDDDLKLRVKAAILGVNQILASAV